MHFELVVMSVSKMLITFAYFRIFALKNFSWWFKHGLNLLNFKKAKKYDRF